MADVPAALDAVTLGEVFRTVTAQTETLKEIKTAIEKRPTWEDIDRIEENRDLREKAALAAALEREKTQNLAIKALEDTNTWLTRTTFGALATAVVGVAGMAINTARMAGG